MEVYAVGRICRAYCKTSVAGQLLTEGVMKSFVSLISVLFFVFTAATGADATRLVAASMAEMVSDDMVAQGVIDTFAPDAPTIHLVAVFADAAAGTKIKAVWVAVDAIATPNYEIDSSSVTLKKGEARVHFQISRPDNGWPEGSYKVNLYVDGVLISSVPFKVGLKKAKGSPAPTQPSGGSSALAGSWQCRVFYMGQSGQPGMVVFDPTGSVTVGTQRFSYKILPGNVVRLMDQSGANDYKYKLSGSNLVMSYSDGSVFNCTRLGRAGQGGAGDAGQEYDWSDYGNERQGNTHPDYGGSGYGGNAGNYGGGGMGASENEWRLSGTFCTWSGSSSSYSESSYSSSSRITFDGRGRWSMDSESSFSGNAGIAYGRGGGDSGIYRVTGSQIQYQTASGEQGTAQVKMQQNDGRITEILVDGVLYSPSLCE